jgi:anti-sigma B factor antagonist
MFQIVRGDDGRVRLSGRLDAVEAEKAKAVLDGLQGPVVFDCAELEYVSSAGLGQLLVTYRRLKTAGHELKFVNMMPRVRNVFTYAGLDRVLSIE